MYVFSYTCLQCLLKLKKDCSFGLRHFGVLLNQIRTYRISYTRYFSFIYSLGIMHPPRIINNGDGVIWLNDVKCSGSEGRLLNCSFSNNIEHCSHHDDVGVHCFLSCSQENEGMGLYEKHL